MGVVSLQEDIEEAVLAANLVAERLKLQTMPTDSADRIVQALLKRCKYIVDTMDEMSRLHSDLSRDTRNKIYALRIERDEALKWVGELEAALKSESTMFQQRLHMASRKIRNLMPQKKKRRKKRQKAAQFNLGR